MVVHTQERRGGCCDCAIKCLGVTEIVFGVLILIAGIVAVVWTPGTDTQSLLHLGKIYRTTQDIPMYSFLNTGPGIWCGIILIITGILGVLIHVDSTSRNMYIVNMVFAIISSLITIACMILSGVAIVAVLFLVGVIAAVMHAITIILTFVAMIITMIHACACCQGACHDPAISQQQVVVAQVPAQVAQPGIQPIAMQELPQVAKVEDPPIYPGLSKM